MIRNLKLLGAALVLTLSAATVMAGDYHRQTKLVCSDCHTMHYSVSHNFTDGGAPTGALSGGPNPKLIKASTPNELCKTCHDGQTYAPDTVGANTGTHVREAGGLTTGVAPYEDWKGHTLGYTGAIPGGTTLTGSSATAGLQCVTCHSTHGGGTTGVTYTDLADPVTAAANGQWRNLTSKPNGSTTPVRLAYVKGATNDPNAEIHELDGTLGQISTHYSVDNVVFNMPDTTKSAYADWCKSCHTAFHGNKSTANMYNGTDWVRHPTADALISTTSTSRWIVSGPNQPKVLVGAAANTFTPSCFTCHKSHGNQNAFGLIYMSGTGTVTEQGDDGTGIRDMCRKCHSQGG